MSFYNKSNIHFTKESSARLFSIPHDHIKINLHTYMQIVLSFSIFNVHASHYDKQCATLR